MGIFTQWLELKQIAGQCMANAGTPDDGNAIMGGTTVSRAETLQDFPIRAGASAIRLLFENARINFGTTANQADMETSANAQRRISGTGSGSFVSLASAVSVPKGVTVLTDPVSLTVSAGEELTVACYGKSMTSGKYMSATRQLIARGLGAVGDTLTFDGTGAVSGDYFQDDGWSPGLILGKTRAKGLGAFGHSLVVARLNFGFSGACIGADRLGIPFAAFGLGGSLLTAWNSSANFDIAALIGRNLIIHGMVNATNNFANDATLNAITGSSIPTYSGGTWTTSMADQLRDKVRRIAAFGIRVFVVTENFPGTAASARKLETWHYWNEWLVSSAAAYCGAALAGVIDTRPYFADTPYINGIPLASTADGPASDDIHSNWEHFGSAIEDAFKSGGTFNSYLTPDENNLVEANVETFYGASATPGAAGALPSGWSEWYYSPTESPRLAINGTGALKVVSPTTKTTYAIWNTAIGGSDASKTCVIRAVSAPWVAQTDGQGLGIHLHSVGGTVVDNTTHAAGGAREGYYIRISNTTTQLNVNRQRFNSVNDQATYGVASSVISNVTGYAGNALAAGDILSVEVTRTYDAGTGNNTFTVLVYKNGILLTPSSGLSTWTDTVTTAPFRGNLYPSVGTAGNTATTHTNNAATWDYVQFGNYDATVIDTVTGPATAYVARGGSEPVEVTVTQSAPTVGPAVGVTVTASLTSLTGATIGSSATTDGTGVARFSEGSALTIPDSLAVGDTGTITFVCGGVSETTPVEVIENAGSGTGGGARSIFGGYLQ